MQHLFKIALLVVLASLGGVFAFAGAGLWADTHRTTPTIFETMSEGEGDAMMCGNIDWVDKPFLLHRVEAAAIFLFGASIVCWSGTAMLKKGHFDFAA
jgi:hypothetical protein